MALRASDIDALLSPAPAQSRPRGLRASDIDALIGAPTLRANASGSAGAVNKKAEAIWGGSFDDWKKRKEADDAERARMVAESEAGNVGSRRAQEFQRETAILAETDALRNKPGEFNFGATGQMMRAGAERAIGGALRFAGESAAPVVGLMDAARNPEAFVRGTTDRGEIPSNAVLAAGQDNALANVGSELAATGATRARRAQPLLIDRPDDALSVDGLKYYAQQGAISAPQLATTVAAGYLGGPAAALLAAGGTAFGTKFADARDENQDFSQAARGALVTAANEAIPEMLPAAAALGKLSRFMPDWMADGIVSRLVATGFAESSTEGITEVANIAYETFGENKPMDRATFINRVKDAVITGGLAGPMVGAVTGTAEYAQARDEVRDDATLRSLRAAIKPRATTARILGPTATPDAAAGAQIADDAFRAAGVGTVAAADMAEQDALARDLDAAQLDQLGSEAEIDRLLTGNAPRERTDLYRASIPGAIPQGVQVTSNQDAFAAPGTIGGRDAPAPIQVTTLADRSVFVPGDPVAIRQKLADAGSQWQGMAQERDGVPGVRFSPTSWADVQGVVGGSVRAIVGDRGNGGGPGGAQAGELAGVPSANGYSPARALDAGDRGARVGPVADFAPVAGVAGNASGTTTQAAAAVDGPLASRGIAGSGPDVLGNEPAGIGGTGGIVENVARNDDAALRGPAVFPTTGAATGAESGAAGGDQQGATPAPPALQDLTDDERNFWGALTAEVRESIDNPGGRMIRNADGSVGRTKWADLGPMSGFWRERPKGWNSDDVLTALDRAASGEKLTRKQSNIVDYAKGWVRDYAAQHKDELAVYEADSRQIERESVRDDIESTLASVADTSPQQRASVASLGHDYTAKLIELKRARAAGALNPEQQEAYIDLLEQDRETGKVGGRPMVGIGNKTAYVDALMQGKLMPVQVFLDADNFKALNDKFGHDVGDDVIRLIADVVRAEFGEGNVFHRGGDEFLTQGMTQEEVDAKMARVQDYLARVKMELPLSDGRTATLTGVGVSYGTGANEKAADDSLKQDKQRRKDAGLRFDRREGDDAGRVGSQSSGAGTEASGANSRDSSRAAAEGVGDERQNRTNLPDAGSSREVAGRRGDAERAPDDLGGSGPRTEAVRGGQAGSREVSGGIATVRSAISQALGAKHLQRLDSRKTAGGLKLYNLVDDFADLPSDVKAQIDRPESAAAFVLPDGRIFIIANRVTDNPVGVHVHELGVHLGMRGILGADFPAVLRNFKRQRAKDAAVGRAYERATEAAERGEDGELTADALATLDEEALAYYVEANWNAKDSRGIVAKVIDAIKATLNRLGIPLSTLNASPEMLRKVAIGAARKAADGRVSVGKDGALRYHKAWHGSPHDFDKFRLDDSTIGTGEGAQAFGFGLYFAGKRELAEFYRHNLSRDREVDRVNAEIQKVYREMEKYESPVYGKYTSPEGYRLKGEYDALMDKRDDIRTGKIRSGKTYEVELAPNESDYLDWDAPLSEQSEKVRGVMLPLVADEVSRRNAERERMNALSPGRLTHPVISKLATKVSTADSITGQSAYESLSKKLGGDRQASAALHAAGIPGIRYLDGSSRGGKTGWRVKFKNGQYSGKVFDTKAEADAAVERGEYNMVDRVEKIDDLSHNFVIFDDSQVEVKAKYSRRADGGPESLRVVTAGDVVDGRTVREGVPNQSSIASSLDDYTIIKGIREVPMDAFDKEYVEGIAEGRIDKRTQDLADAISASKEITPLIVAYDADGAYIIEGGHRLDALIKIGAKSLPAMVVIDEANPPKLASEGLGASGDTDARIAYSRKTAEPEGLPPPVAIESHLSNMLKLRAFWDSAVDVMARQPGLKPLADAVRSYFDNVRRRQGLVNEVLRAPVKAASKADLDAFERYQYALQNNLRADVSEELAGMTDKGRALVSAWEKVAKLTNDENQKVGVQVFDPKIGGWRKIGTARNFFPRVLKPKFQEAMRQPHKYPAEWNQLVRILLDAGRIQSAEDAQEFLNRSFSNESAFEYFAGIEKARMEPLPRDLYDYSMDAAIGYKDAWADRLSQIEAFGQRIGQGDQAKDKFDEVLLTVTDDNTRNYVTRVRERITNTNSKSPFYKFMANMNTLVTGLMLGNPATAALNIVGGLSNNAMVFPIGPNLKALKELRKLGDGIRDAVAKGVLIDDYMGVSADAAAQGVSERLSNLTQGLLNWGGYNGTEYINRVHSMLVGKHFLSDSLAAINKNPRSRKSLLATAFLQRNGFDIDTLAAESTKPADERPETNKFLRFASNLTQGSYKIDQTPIFVDEPIGKFLFKYQKFGTQINRVFYQQMLRPFVQSVFKGGEPVTLKNADGTEAQERVRNFVPLIRFIVGAIPGGMLVQFVREAFFGYGEDGPDEDEIRRKLADGETAAAAAMLAERAFIAITALGAGGFLGNYMQTAKDFQERQRYKNPMDPPGLAPVKSFVNFVMKLNDQGKITMDDVEQEIQNNVSLYRTTKRLLSSGINMVSDESVTFAAREAARREHNHVRYMARRYADSVGIEAKRRAPSEIATTANTPTNRAIKDALLLGDGETARALAAEYVASFDNAYDAANALASIRNSIRLGQPALVQLAPSETERRRFMRWAFSNLTPEGYARIKETDEKYRKAAASSGLWKPESDAAAMKRDRKADESKAQWSESQRNSFLRSKGLKR